MVAWAGLIGLGCMRLSTALDDDAAVALLTAALDAGVTLLDTADVYGRDDDDPGHNERLVARVRRPGVTVVTKGGLVRRAGRWEPDGRALHLEAAALASRDRLEAIDLYLLHAVDPQVPQATSVRALARLRERGVVGRIGLSNVTRTQLDEALALTEIAAVQVALSPYDVTAVRGGLLARCAERGLTVLAHRPLGGPAGARRLARDRAVAPHAARLGATAAALALAWLRTRGAVPLPGPTRLAHALSAARPVTLDDDARAALDHAFLGLLAHTPGHPKKVRSTALSGEVAHRGGHPKKVRSTALPGEVAHSGDVVVLMGMPAAGKSTAVAAYVERGYARLNRDERGGTLDALARALDDALAAGASRVVLDNTYASRSARAPVIAAARRHGVPVRCVWLDTAIEDAQVNAAGRMLDRHGRLLEPAELSKAARREPGTFGPSAQFKWRRELEPPALDEGFADVEVARFERRPEPGGRPALIVELAALPPEGVAVLARWRDAGWAVVATGWAPAGDAAALIAAIEARLAAPLDVAWCAHPAGPPVCWCRKPMPGLGLLLARRHQLDLARSLHVGRGPADRGFAARLGAGYLDATEWLAAPALAP